MGARIQIARNQRGYSQSQLASMVGVTRGACGQWERDISCPSVENLSQLAIMLNVNFEWLATGQNDDVSNNGIKEPASGYRAHCLTDEQRELLACYGKLSSSSQQALLKLLQVL